MSSSNPNPEEHKRIVDAAVNEFIKNHAPVKAPSELEQLAAKKSEIRTKIKAKLGPMIDDLAHLPLNDPRYLHSESGKLFLLEHTVKLLVDELRQFNREEALFLLAFAWSEMAIAEFV